MPTDQKSLPKSFIVGKMWVHVVHLANNADVLGKERKKGNKKVCSDEIKDRSKLFDCQN